MTPTNRAASRHLSGEVLATPPSVAAADQELPRPAPPAPVAGRPTGHRPASDGGTTASAKLSPEAVRAWESSALVHLSHNRDVLRSAGEVRVDGGDSIFQFDDPRRLFLAIMVSGVARVYTRSPQGRQVTIRYASDGDWIGLPIVLAPRVFSGGIALAVQALTPCHLLRLSIPAFRQSISRDVDNMWRLIEELARSMATTNSMLAENVFLPVRARVARHLLDMAKLEDSRWIVHASQQDVADAIGSVREVVSRAILSLRDDGLLHRDSSWYVLDSPAGLHDLTVAERPTSPPS